MTPRRSQHLPRIALLGSLLVAAGMLLAQGPAQGKGPKLDLDALSDARLNQLLQNELDFDDLADCGLDNPRAPKSKDEMFDIIMCALGDDNDGSDEVDLDFEDLQDEMEEAGTTVEEVVARALERADVMALAPGAPASWLVAAGGFADAAPWAAPTQATPGKQGPLHLPSAAQPPAEPLLAIRDGRINPSGAAIGPVKGGVIQAVRSRR